MAPAVPVTQVLLGKTFAVQNAGYRLLWLLIISTRLRPFPYSYGGSLLFPGFMASAPSAIILRK